MESIRRWTDYLEQLWVSFRIIMDAAPYSMWIDRHLPTNDSVGRIEWAQVANASHLPPAEVSPPRNSLSALYRLFSPREIGEEGMFAHYYEERPPP
jgi:hypothetical protein